MDHLLLGHPKREKMKLWASKHHRVSRGTRFGTWVRFHPKEGRAPRCIRNASTTIRMAHSGFRHEPQQAGVWGCICTPLLSRSPPSLPGSEGCRFAVPSLRGSPPTPSWLPIHKGNYSADRGQHPSRFLRHHYADIPPPGVSPAPGATALQGTAGTSSSRPFWATRENTVQKGNWYVRK